MTVRKFLVVVDKTPECRVALRYAARRAQHTTGRLTLLAIAAPPDFHVPERFGVLRLPV